jgi:hypothetical protein
MLKQQKSVPELSIKEIQDYQERYKEVQNKIQDIKNRKWVCEPD